MASSSSSATASISVAGVTGPMLLGHLFNWALFGALAIQVYIYANSFPNDRAAIKVLVYTVFFFDILQTVFTTHYAWYVLAAGWGNPLTLQFTTWSLATVPPVTGIISLLVQLFYSWRIWVLSQGKKIIIPILTLIVLSGLGSCIASFYAAVVSGINRDLAKASTLDKEVTAWMSQSLACDIMITLTLVFLLAAHRNEGFGATKHLIHRAIRLTIETGAATTIVVIVELALYLNSELTSWYFLLGLSIGKVYSNSLLASLNSRSDTFKVGRVEGSTGIQVWESTTRITSNNGVVSHSEPNDIELGHTTSGPEIIRGGEYKGRISPDNDIQVYPDFHVRGK